eukprot:PhM_4_TR18487/c0_g1_i1/m.65520
MHMSTSKRTGLLLKCSSIKHQFHFTEMLEENVSVVVDIIILPKERIGMLKRVWACLQKCTPRNYVRSILIATTTSSPSSSSTAHRRIRAHDVIIDDEENAESSLIDLVQCFEFPLFTNLYVMREEMVSYLPSTNSSSSSKSSYVAMMNNDVLVSPGWLDALTTSLIASTFFPMCIQPFIFELGSQQLKPHVVLRDMSCLYYVCICRTVQNQHICT